MTHNPQKIKWHNKFTFRFFLIFLSFTIVVITLLTATLTRQMRSFALEDAYEFILEESNRLQREVDIHLDGIEVSMHLISTSSHVIDLDLEEVHKMSMALIDKQPSVSQVYIMDKTGMQIYKSSFPETIGDRSDRAYFQGAITGKSLFSDVIISRSTKIPIVVHAQPIYRNGEIDGVIGCSIDLDILSNMVTPTTVKSELNTSSYGFIVESNGIIIAHPNETLVGELFNASHIEPIKAVIAGKSGIGTYIYEDQERITSFIPSNKTEWGILYQTPASEVFKEVAYVNRSMFLFALAIILTISLLFVVAAYEVHRPIRKILNMIPFIEDRYDFNDFQVSKNEFGIIEKQLIHMSASINRSHMALESQVDERTNELEETMERLMATKDDLASVNQLLKKQSLTDHLTKLPNRRSLDDYLKHTWELLIRENKTVALVMINIDYFKGFNDVYGHQAGDICLIEVAHLLRVKLKRGSDFLGRHGGDQFMAVLYDISMEDTVELVQDLCHSVFNELIPNEASRSHEFVTISCGIAYVMTPAAISAGEAELAAENILYKAKDSGRNTHEITILKRDIN